MHSDLQDDHDMDLALKNTGAVFQRYHGRPGDFQGYIDWIQNQLRKGRPVICECKIYPTEHPDWDGDHYILATGYNSKGLLLNTQLDCDGQLLISYKQLGALHEGYSFKNPSNEYWGRSIVGVK